MLDGVVKVGNESKGENKIIATMEKKLDKKRTTVITNYFTKV